MTETYSAMPEVELGGSQLPEPLAPLLESVLVDCSLNQPAFFELTFSRIDDEAIRALPRSVVGSEVVVWPVESGTRGRRPLLTAEVVAMDLGFEEGRRTLRLRGYDAAYRLMRGRRVDGYPNSSADEIVRGLASKNSIRTGKIEKTLTVYELATQPNISDWDFLTRLAIENDAYLYVDRQGRLQFTKGRSTAGEAGGPTELDVNEIQVRGRIGVSAADQVGSVTARGWDVKAKRALTHNARVSEPGNARIGVRRQTAAGRFASTELIESDRPYTTGAQVRAAATAQAGDMADSFAELDVKIEGGMPDLGPGSQVRLKNLADPFGGTYTVTSAEHSYGPEGFSTRIQVSGRQVRSLYGLTSGAAQAAPPMPGVVNAQVSNVADPDRNGRVKLKFPWLSDRYESDWCRVAQFGGVAGGGLNLPNVDDEVLVAFDRGSLEHPYVIAGLYNGVDMVPRLPGAQYPATPKGGMDWRTVGSRKGHRFELRDGIRDSGLRLSTGNGANSLYLRERPNSITVASRGVTTIKVGDEEGPGTVAITVSPAGVNIRGPLRVEGPVTFMGPSTTVNGVFQTLGGSSFRGPVSVVAATSITGLLTVQGAPPLINAVPLIPGLF
jgi:phage protein D